MALSSCNYAYVEGPGRSPGGGTHETHPRAPEPMDPHSGRMNSPPCSTTAKRKSEGKCTQKRLLCFSALGA